MAAKILCSFLVVFCLSCFQGIQATITQFNLYTPGISSPEIISAGQRGNLGNRFNASQKLTFIIHGYLDSYRAQLQWITNMRTELMKRESRNIIVVDWGLGSSGFYPIAVQNTRVVGSEIAALIQQLCTRHNYTLSKIHVIGHSLGAHVAGYAGAEVQAGKKLKLGRITGLDPAGPSFDHNNNHERLDPSDADFVDVIHTNKGGLGLARPCGHVDFYPNGGKDQPGCSSKDYTSLGILSSSLSELKRNFPYSPQDICDHLFVSTLFTASINNRPKCLRKAFPCTNWKAFKKGSCPCKGACAEMGYNADQHYRGSISKSFKKFYLKTSNSYPYCAPPFYYHVTLHDLRVNSVLLLTGNEIKIQLHGKTVKLSNVKSGTVSELIVDNNKLDPLQHISISYKGSTPYATIFLGKVTVVGPQLIKYEAEYNTYLSSGIVPSFFSFFSTLDFKTYQRPLRKIN